MFTNKLLILKNPQNLYAADFMIKCFCLMFCFYLLALVLSYYYYYHLR